MQHRRRPTRRATTRYWLIQLPATFALVVALYVVWRMFAPPVWILVTITAVWVLKDAALYFLVWQSYDPDDEGSLGMRGATGTALDDIASTGPVHVRGERWRAELAFGASPVARGETVRVVSIRDLTLVVEGTGDELGLRPADP